MDNNLISDQEKSKKIKEIYNNFLSTVNQLKKAFNDKIQGILKKKDEQKMEDIKNKINQM